MGELEVNCSVTLDKESTMKVSMEEGENKILLGVWVMPILSWCREDSSISFWIALVSALGEMRSALISPVMIICL